MLAKLLIQANYCPEHQLVILEIDLSSYYYISYDTLKFDVTFFKICIIKVLQVLLLTLHTDYEHDFWTS